MGQDDQPSFKDLDARLKQARKAREPRPARREARPLGVAFRLSVEMVVGLVVGGVIGYFLDRWLGTSPWLLLVFFFLGAAAGIRNVMRAAEEISRQAEAEEEDGDGDDKGSPPS